MTKGSNYKYVDLVTALAQTNAKHANQLDITIDTKVFLSIIVCYGNTFESTGLDHVIYVNKP